MRGLYPLALAVAVFALMPVCLSVPLQEKQTTSLGSTMIRGVILHLRSINMGHELQFRALFVHYRTHYMGQESDGVLHGLQRITMKNDYYGLVRNHYIFAHFDGTIVIG